MCRLGQVCIHAIGYLCDESCCAYVTPLH
jgi:hypothetical protein